MIGAYLVGFTNAMLALVIAFGLSLTSNQTGAITAAVNAAILLGTAIWHFFSGRKTPPTTPTIAASRSTVL